MQGPTSSTVALVHNNGSWCVYTKYHCFVMIQQWQAQCLKISHRAISALFEKFVLGDLNDSIAHWDILAEGTEKEEMEWTKSKSATRIVRNILHICVQISFWREDMKESFPTSCPVTAAPDLLHLHTKSLQFTRSVLSEIWVFRASSLVFS